MSGEYRLTSGEILTLTRWLLGAEMKGAITKKFLEDAKVWLSDLVIDRQGVCKVQNKELYLSFEPPESSLFPGSFWHEICRVLEFPINKVWRVNYLWKVGQKVYVTKRFSQYPAKGVVLSVRDLGCTVRLDGINQECYFDDENLSPRLPGVWKPWETLGVL